MSAAATGGKFISTELLEPHIALGRTPLGGPSDVTLLSELKEAKSALELSHQVHRLVIGAEHAFEVGDISVTAGS